MVEESKIPADYTPDEDTDPLCELGKIAFNAEDYEKAADCFRKAAELGVRRGQYNLGHLYANGLGVEQDFEKAAAYYQLAAEQGFARARFNLAHLYEKGQGVEQNYEKPWNFTLYCDTWAA